jgi:Plectin/S10 domain
LHQHHAHAACAPPDPNCLLRAEGVLQAPKDFNLAKHPEIDVPNLQVIKLMQSFTSKQLVTERFAWQHYYWCVAALCSVWVGQLQANGHSSSNSSCMAADAGQHSQCCRGC